MRIEGVKTIDILSVLIVLTTVTSVDQWSKIPLGPIAVVGFIFVISYLCVCRIYIINLKDDLKNLGKSRQIINLYILWVLLSFIRGFLFQAEGYWDYKSLFLNTAALLLPSLIYVFYKPDYTEKVLSLWMKYALPAFILFIPIVERSVYSRYLAPILLLGCFIPTMKKKWRFVFILLLLFNIFVDFTARSQVIKAVICLLISFSVPLVKLVPQVILRIVHYFLYCVPFLLLFLAITDTFNIFSMDEYLEDVQVEGSTGDDESLIADTRTFIYEEVILSAINNEYVLYGRTPARGYDSMAFGRSDEKVAEDQGSRDERYASEVLHPNVFTWIGIIGLFLYSILYFIASSRAVFKSNNSYMKLLGLYVAFRWLYGWVEDWNQWDIMNISLWIMIAMCYSPYFRQMNDEEITNWVRACMDFKKKKDSPTLIINHEQKTSSNFTDGTQSES